MINIAICDDEQNMLDWLSEKVEMIFSEKSLVFNISTFQDGNTLLNFHKQSKIDIAFLDIDMQPINGFQTAEKIKQSMSRTYIVFVTSKHHLMKQSFDYQPFNFICKDTVDILLSDLKHVCENLIKNFKQNTIITIKDNVEGIYEIPVCDLLYITSDKHYLNHHILLQTAEGKRYFELKERGTIYEKQAALKNFDFLKPHRRYLVNMHHITKLGNAVDGILLSNGEKIPVSQTLKNEIINQYMIYKRR